MKYSFDEAVLLLERTPRVLATLLEGLPDGWVRNNEGADTWSAFDVVGHLLVCEQTDFMDRTAIILNGDGEQFFAPIDMQAQFEAGKGKTLTELLHAFAEARQKNLETIRRLHLSDEDLNRTGMHRKIGRVTLRNLWSTWVAHDLIHTAQIARVMAKQYREEVGPFIEYLRILN